MKIAALCVLLFCAAAGFAGQTKPTEVTFSRDVAPILYKNCAGCHRPGDIAPFSVLTYKDVRPWARSIKEKTVTRDMPPWHADPRYGDFKNVARLSQEDIDTIARWVDQGAKEGDPKDLPPVPSFVDGWKIGKPDMELEMDKAYTIEPNAPDQYVYFIFHPNFKEDKWVQAAEVRPGNREVVHHVIAHVITPRAMAAAKKMSGVNFAGEGNTGESIFKKMGSLTEVRMDAPVIDDGANSPNCGAAFKRHAGDEDADGFSFLLASYAPGKPPDVYPPGMAKEIPKGSIIVLQLHYSSFRGKLKGPVTDRTRVGLIFAKTPPTKRVVTMTIPNHYFEIPPGDPDHKVTACYTFDRNVELIDYMPHMHLRGKDMKYDAIFPDGRRETLISVPKFNFNWQTVYTLKKPLPIPKGTKIIVTAHFDNSARNKYNPDPTKAVRWGDPTYDEMMIGWLDYAVPISDDSNDVAKGGHR